jgi:hypothetical protein
MKRYGLAEIGSGAAVLISLLALVISFYQTRIAERQAHASVWPYVSINYDISDEGEKRGFTWTVENNGLGPALIQSVVISVDGKPRKTWAEVCVAIGITSKNFAATSSLISGRVLPPDTNRDTTIPAFHAIAAPEAKLFLDARPRLGMDICYCSVYAECWVAHFEQQRVETVERCETAGTVQFTQ